MNYLALGDSYTIGESVPLHDSFPYQVVQLMRKKGHEFSPPEIIAKTGWTTDELLSHLSAIKLLPSYQFVSLLIGVNNQYRKKPLDEYRQQFETLLKKSIRLAANQSSKVIVVSIPDWGVTPYAEGRDVKKISEEIDDFNLVNKSITLLHQANYIDITPGSREALTKKNLLANDGLHPSALEYSRWATMIAAKMESQISN